MAVRALDIGEGDEVITTPFSFVASANCLLYERAIPEFVDIEDDSLGARPGPRRARHDEPDEGGPAGPCLRPAVQDRADRRPRAARAACRSSRTRARASGSSLNGRPLGGFGDIAVFAFYPNKQITTGEGGMAVTDDPALADVMRSLRNQGRDTDGTWLRHVRLGYNYRLDELSAAVGVAQIERLAELRAGRDRVAAAYERGLGGRDWVRLPKAGPGETVDWFVYVVRLDPRDRPGRAHRPAQGPRACPSRPYFSPLHLQPFYRSRFGFKPGDFPITERVAASTLALPFSSRHTDEDIAFVCEALIEAASAA